MKGIINRRPLGDEQWVLTMPLVHALASHVFVLESSALVCEECHQLINADIHLNIGESRQDRINSVREGF